MVVCSTDSSPCDSVSINCRVQRELRDRLDDCCFELGWSRERLLNLLLADALDRLEIIPACKGEDEK